MLIIILLDYIITLLDTSVFSALETFVIIALYKSTFTITITITNLLCGHCRGGNILARRPAALASNHAPGVMRWNAEIVTAKLPFGVNRDEQQQQLVAAVGLLCGSTHNHVPSRRPYYTTTQKKGTAFLS